MSIYNLTGPWKNHEGKVVNLKDFSGKVVVAAMVYTSCQHTCPMITQKVVDIRKALPKKLREKVVYALISFDPEGDTPKVLAAYKKKSSLDKHWVLLTSDAGTVRKLAGVIGFNYKKTPDGGFAHSNMVNLVDPQGVVTYQIDGLNKANDEMVKKIVTLLK